MNINLIALEDGLVVLSVGFFVVFMFLTVMIFAMLIMGKIVAYLNKIFPPVAPALATAKRPAVSDDTEVAIAIAASLMKQKS